MPYDIYGNNLRSGHCEVHPHVHETYPCSVCIGEARSRDDEQRRYEFEMDRLYAADMDKFYWQGVGGDGI